MGRFCPFPLDPERIKSEKGRLDVSNAVYVDSEEYKLGLGDDRGFIITSNDTVYDDDEFEAMEVSEAGAVTIWTKKRVWALHKDRGLEKLYFVYRHPQFSDSK